MQKRWLGCAHRDFSSSRWGQLQKSYSQSMEGAPISLQGLAERGSLMQGLVERDRLAFMAILPEDLREDVQKAFQLREARKWGGNAPLEGLAALESMPDPDQMGPFKNIGFGEKVRLLSAMSPAQVSAILGEL